MDDEAFSPFVMRASSFSLHVAAVHAQPGLQLFELLGVAVAGRVDVLGLGDELQLVVAADAALAEDRPRTRRSWSP